MGACSFDDVGRGSTAKEAFNNAVQQAQYDHGHSGYSGTIAEKNSFVKIAVPEGREPIEYAEELMDEADERIDDKWGPAGCVELGEGRYYFFGYASS